MKALPLLLLAVSALAHPQPPPTPAPTYPFMGTAIGEQPAVYDSKAQWARNQAIAPTKFPILPIASRSDPPTVLAAAAGDMVTWEIGASPSASTNAGLGYLLYYWQVTIPATVVHSVPATAGPSNIFASVMIPSPGRWHWGATAVNNSNSVESAMVTHSNRYPWAYAGELVTSDVTSGADTPFMTNLITLDKFIRLMRQQLRQVIIP